METTHLFQNMDTRRRELRMSYAALSKRSKVPVPTLVRTLTGKNQNVGFSTVVAIAEALSTSLQMTAKESKMAVLEREATEKAKRLVGMVQSTSALEAQGVSEEKVNEMIRMTVHELMACKSGRKIWG